MANIIQIKRKTTTGDPTLGVLAIGELCLNTVDNILHLKRDAGTLLSWPAGSGAGDMLAATYDPTAKNTDAFDMDNMAEGASTKILTDTERTSIAAIAANTSKPDQSSITTEIGDAISALVGGAPVLLDTLNELAEAIADDEAYSVTITTALGNKLDANSTIDGGEIT